MRAVASPGRALFDRAGHPAPRRKATGRSQPGQPRGHVKGRNDLVVSAAYLPEPAAVAAARKFVRDTLCSWLVPGSRGRGCRGRRRTGGRCRPADQRTGHQRRGARRDPGTGHLQARGAAPSRSWSGTATRPGWCPAPRPTTAFPPSARAGGACCCPPPWPSAWGVSYGTDAKAVWFRMGAAAGAARTGPERDAGCRPGRDVGGGSSRRALPPPSRSVPGPRPP